MAKSNIKKAGVFIVVALCVIYAVQSGIDAGYRSRVINKFSRLFKHQVDPGIMIFGSSTAYYHFDPRIIKNVTGESAYNMGWYGVNFVQYNALVNEYLSYEKNCHCIVIICDIQNLVNNELITRPDLFLAYLRNDFVYQSLKEIEPRKIFLARYLPGYKLTLLNNFFYRDLFFCRPDDPSLEGYGTPGTSKWNKIDTAKPFKANYDDNILMELRLSIENMNRKGIKVVLVIPPIYQEGYKLIQNIDEIKSKYRSLVQKDVFFLDYTSDPICKSIEYFNNYSHLNTEGAAIFSTNFATDLVKIMH